MKQIIIRMFVALTMCGVTSLIRLTGFIVGRQGSEQEGTASKTIVGNLVELSRKMALVVRRLDSTAVKALFAELEEYDS